MFILSAEEFHLATLDKKLIAAARRVQVPILSA
jgi:hypothetical protein